MDANINTTVHRYEVVKYNKQSTNYKLVTKRKDQSVLTDEVKVEVFQGYSKVYNLGLYFRLKDQSSWSKSTQLTGMFKTKRPGLYYGDKKTPKGKTLMLFYINPNNDKLTIYEYPEGYYPSQAKRDRIINSFKP